MKDTKLREKLRDILFKAAGGITDMGDKEIDQIMQLFSKETEKRVQTVIKEIHEAKQPLQAFEGRDMYKTEVVDIDDVPALTNDKEAAV